MSNTLAAVAIAGAVLVAGLTEFDRANVAATPMPIEAPPQNPAGPPDLPKTTVDTKEPAITGRTIHVPAGGSLQGAIDQAKPGDRITLQPAATYDGPFRLRPKTGDGWIVITTSATDLPKPGQRVTPADARRMPKITGSAEALIEAEAGAHHYRLVGLEVTPTDGASVTNLIQIGAAAVIALTGSLVAEQPIYPPYAGAVEPVGESTGFQGRITALDKNAKTVTIDSPFTFDRIFESVWA